MEIHEDIKSTETYSVVSAVAVDTFDQAKNALERKGYEVISLEQNAQLRMEQEIESNISKRGNLVREGVLYVPGKGIFLTKNSPIMENPKTATKTHRKGLDFYLTEGQVEMALEGSVAFSAKKILTSRFGEDEITSFAFGKIAEQYGDFLGDVGILSIPIVTTYLQNKPFSRQLWFGCLYGRDGSSYLGDDWNLGFENTLRGVKNKK